MLEQNTIVADCLEDSAFSDLFDFLIDVLKRELVIYGELKKFLCREKQMILKAPPIENIHENNTFKENLVLKARILEEGRNNILKKLARRIGLEDQSLSLSILANYAGKQQCEEMEALKKELARIAREIKTLNDENKYLIDVSINTVKGSLEFISSLVNCSGIYQGNGKIGEIKRNGNLVRTEG